VIGLLSQPGLDPNQRYELDEWIDIQSRLGRQRSFNKRFRYARLHYSVTNRARYVYDRDDPGDISTLINFVGYLARPRGRRSVFMSAQNKAIATMLIYELSRSEHLDEAQLTRLAQALFAHSDVRYGPGTPVLGAALRNMATQLNLGDTALGYFRGLSQQLPTASTLAALLKEVATYEETEPSGTVSNWYHEKTSTDPASYMLGLSVANLSQRTNYNVGNLQALSPEFSAQLGDATSPVSKRSWLLFLGFVEDDPDVPLQNVLDTAKKLAGIDA
jgi:hypothetical protein